MKKKVDFYAFLPPGQHPGMDALARGLAAGITERGGVLRLRCIIDNDAAAMNAQLLRTAAAAAAAVVTDGKASHDSDNDDDHVDAVFLFITQPNEPDASVVASVMEAGVGVYTIHRPWFAVTGSVVVPNFYQGITLANRMAQACWGKIPTRTTTSADSEQRRRQRAPKIAILGGPAIVDDEELVLGCLDGAKRANLDVLNDPFATEYRNLQDIKGASRSVVQRLLTDVAAKMDGVMLDGLIVFNDETLHDVIEYLQEEQLIGKFPIVSRNGSPDAIRWVKQGWTTATFDYNLPEIGRLAATLWDTNDATDHTLQSAKPVVMAPLGTLYDETNVHEYISWETRAPLDIPLNVTPLSSSSSNI